MKIREITEATHYIPHSKDKLHHLSALMSNPIPAKLAPDMLKGILKDDGLYDEIESMAQDKDADARPIIAHWLSLNMPHLTNRYKSTELIGNGEGIFSVLHGFADHDDDSGDSK